MAFQAVPDTALVEVKWLFDDGRTWQNNLHFRKASFLLADMQALAGAVQTRLTNAAMKGAINNSCQLSRIVVTDLRTQGAQQYATVVGVPMLDTGDALPLSDALVITVRTALRGRSFRGRIYVTGLGEARIVDGRIDTAIAVALVNEYTGLKTDCAAIGWTMVIVQRWSNKVQLGTAVTHDVTTMEYRSTIVGSQRRRDRRP